MDFPGDHREKSFPIKRNFSKYMTSNHGALEFNHAGGASVLATKLTRCDCSRVPIAWKALRLLPARSIICFGIFEVLSAPLSDSWRSRDLGNLPHEPRHVLAVIDEIKRSFHWASEHDAGTIT